MDLYGFNSPDLFLGLNASDVCYVVISLKVFGIPSLLSFCCDFSMPPRKSTQTHFSTRPESEATPASAPKRRKSLRTVNSWVNSAPQQSNSMTELEAQQVGLSSHAFEQLVARVSAEVAKTIAPLLVTLQSTNQSASPSMRQSTSSQLSPYDQRINLVEEPILLPTAPVQSSGESMVYQLVNTSVNTLNTTIQGEQCAKSRPI